MLPNPDDPYYQSSTQGPQPNVPYQPAPPPYQSQPGEPSYYSQPTVPPPTAGSADQQRTQARKYGVAKLMDYLQWLLAVLEFVLLLQFALMLLGADPSNPFAAFLYEVAGFFLYPFAGIVPSTKLGTQGNAVIEWSTLIAMAVYALLFYSVKLLLRITISKPQEPIE